MRFLLQKISSYFFPVMFIRASKDDQERVQVKQKRAFTLLDQYDKGEIKIDYSTELKKLKKFTRAN